METIRVFADSIIEKIENTIPSLIIFSVLLLFLSSCNSYLNNPESLATHFVDQARKSLIAGNCSEAGHQISEALMLATGESKAKDLFTTEERGPYCLAQYTGQGITRINTVPQAVRKHREIEELARIAILTETQIEDLYSQLIQVVIESSRSGVIPIILSDEIDRFPELTLAGNIEIIVDRTISTLQVDNSRNRPVYGLMEYTRLLEDGSLRKKEIESLLSSLNFRRYELEHVAEVFPDFALDWEKDLTTQVYVQIKNADRLMSDDLVKALRLRVKGVNWVDFPGSTVTNLTIEVVRNAESILPAQTRTVTYSKYQVDTVNAVLYMPRNASYIYDEIFEGSKIDYGFVVSATLEDETIYDEVVRGSVASESWRCENARVQNVFGGISPASFTANDDMRRRCSGVGGTGIDGLREDVFAEVINGVLEVPTIGKVHNLN